jgi:hypothetical protein
VRRRALLAVALLAACDRAGQGLVHLELEAAPGVILDMVEVSVTTAMEPAAGQAALNRQTVAWAPGADGKLSLGLYVSSSTSGLVWAHARGLRGGQEVASAAAQSAEVRPGKVSALVTLRLVAGAAPPGDAGAGPPDGGASKDAAVSADGTAPAADGAAPAADGAGPADGAGDRPAPAADGGGSSPGWTPPANVEKDEIDREFEAVVAVDPVKGDAVAAFVERQAQIKVVRYDAAAGRWSAPQPVASGTRAGHLRVGMDTGRHVLLLWTQAGDGVRESHSSDGGATWSPSALVRATAAAINTSLAVSRNGRARAAWEESAGNYNVMFTAYWDGAAWSTPAMPLASQDFFSTRQASVVIDGAGAGWIAWSQPEPDSPLASARLYVSRYTAAALEPPLILDKDAGSVQPPPVMAMAPDGKAAVVIWQQNYKGGGAHDFLASLWSPAAGWGAPEKAVPGAGELPAVVMDGVGAVTVAYQGILTTARRNVVAVRREPGMGWGQPVPLERDNTSPGGAGVPEGQPSPVMGVDAQGNVQVAWRKGQSSTTYGLSSRRFVAGKDWEPEAAIDVRTNLMASWPLSMATTDAGRSLLVWVYRLGTPAAMDPDLYSLMVSFFPAR